MSFSSSGISEGLTAVAAASVNSHIDDVVRVQANAVHEEIQKMRSGPPQIVEICQQPHKRLQIQFEQSQYQLT